MANKLEDLRLLAAVVQFGSFTQAAAHTGTTQSRVSRAIARLEKELGVSLVHRSSRCVAPTPSGRKYAEFAQHTLAQLAHMEAELKGDDPGARLSISSPPAVGRRLLAAPIAAFCRSHPDIAIHWSLGARRVDLIAEEVDVAIRFGPLPETWRRARTIVRGAYHVVAAPGLADGRTWPEANGHIPILGLHVTHLRNRWPLIDPDGVLTWVSVAPQVWADDADALIGLAIAGAGATILPDFLVADALHKGQLMCLTTPRQTVP
ncbi:MAG: LysR family transcriptional regulator, partial [Myxococcota bacterium]